MSGLSRAYKRRPKGLPLSIPGLQLWLDASDASTLFQDSAGTTPATADGDPVGCWKDKSGNAKNATQTDGTKKPALKSSILNGKPIVRLDGISDTLDILNTKSYFNFLSSTQGMVFALFRTNPLIANPDKLLVLLDNNNLGLAGYGLNYDDRSSRGANDAMISYAGSSYPDGSNFLIIPNDIVQAGTWKLVANKVRGQDSTLSNRTFIYINGSQVSSTNSYNGTYTGDSTLDMSIGHSRSEYTFNGDIAEIIIYNSALSDNDRATIQNYLNAKWSIY